MSTPIGFDKFLAAYIECALWSSTDNSRDDGGEPLDANYSRDDLSRALLDDMVEDCRAFMESEEWKAASQAGFWTLEQGGHDFWLTRNRHGAGFWDRYSGGHEGEAHGRALSALADTFGGCDLYVGDDGRIYA